MVWRSALVGLTLVRAGAFVSRWRGFGTTSCQALPNDTPSTRTSSLPKLELERVSSVAAQGVPRAIEVKPLTVDYADRDAWSACPSSVIT